MYKSVLKKLALACGSLVMAGTLHAQPYGLNQGTAIGSYLNSTLPTTAPNVSATYDVTVAYTNLVFNQPLYFTPYLRTNWMVLIEKAGVIRIFPNKPEVTTGEVKVFLDISSRVYNSSDSGMTAIAFHPEFGLPGSTNRGFVYITYKWRPNPDLGANGAFAYYRLSRFNVPDGTMAVDTNSEVVMLQQFDQQEWHDSGCLMFGQDGYLYFGVGDEGGANDQYNATQTISERLMSGIFRVDVNKNPSTSHAIIRQPFHHPNMPVGWPESFSTNYFVPNNNPFVNTNGSNLEEYYALGFRNPYRFTQDPVTGLIWIGDVGQSTREEVNVLSPGKNYQWAYREGFIAGPKATPGTIIGTEQLPLWDYPHAGGDGCVIGGYVYRGTNFPGLVGKYIVADNVSGRIWALTSTNGITLESAVQIANMPPGSVYGGTSSIGQDPSGELYFVKIGGTGAGQIYKLKAIVTIIADPATPLSTLGVFTNMTTLAPLPGLRAYTVNSPLWSDGAVKKRWMAVPNNGTHDTAAEQIIFSPTNDWVFPSGTVFVKHFDLPVNDTNSAITKRVETRLLVIDQNNAAYGLTYKWRADGTDADLLTTGQNADYTIATVGGILRTQTWAFPSRQDCLACHTANAGYVLGLKTHQMNCPTTFAETGVTDNQLRALGHIGLLGANYSEVQLTNYLKSYAVTDTNVSLELRVRSYLDANCSQCHRPGGVYAYIDTRYVTPLPLQGLIQGPTHLFITDTNDRAIVPMDLPHSLVHNRASRVGQFQMPPLAKNVVDSNAVQVIAAWINSLPPGPGVTLTLANPNALVSGAFNVTALFTESVTGVTTNKFTVSNAQITGLTGSGTTYTVTVNPLTNGTVTVQFPGGQVTGLSGGTNYVSNTLTVNYDPLNQFLTTWLPFEEGSGTTTTDASGNGNNGTLNSMVQAAWTTGKTGAGLSFDGVNDYVGISNHLGSNFTITCWIKTSQIFPTATPTYLGTGIIWSDVGGSAADFIMGGTRNGTGVNRLSLFVGGSETTLSGTQEISTGQWVHLAVTRNGVNGEVRLYVNGILDGSATAATGLLNANPSIAVGGNTLDNRYFNGLIDDVRFYSTALSGTEVASFVPPNIPPTISSIGDQTINRNASAGPLNFTVGDAETSASALTVTASSSNTGLVPNANIVFGGSGENRTVTITPLVNEAGSTTITLTVNDGIISTNTTFTVNVLGALVAHYRLDGNALDSSGSNNHGTINGGVTFVSGKIGTNAASFNGTSGYVQIPVSVRSDFTIAFWAKTTDTGGTGQWNAGKGFVDGDVSGATTDFGTALIGAKLGFGIGNPNTTISSVTSVNDGQWHLLAVTRTSASGAMNVYVDGVLEATGTGATGLRAAPTALRIGSVQSGGAAKFLNGTMDDVRLYDYVLSGAEIAALTNTTIAPSITTPPMNQTLAVGQSTNLSVVTAGTSPLTYQWRRSGTNLAGANVASLALNSVQLTDAGNYSVVVSNSAGSVTSAVAVVTVYNPTSIAGLLHRWSFNNGADTVGSAHATLVGAASYASGQLQLPGGGVFANYASADIGNTLSNHASITVESWFTLNQLIDWSKVWMFGRDAAGEPNLSYINFTPRTAIGGNPPKIDFDSALAGEFNTAGGTDPAALTTSSQYHVVTIFDAANDVMSYYINGTLADSAPMGSGNITQLQANIARFGAGFFFADPDLNGSINELRIWDGAMNSTQVAANFANGTETITLVVPRPIISDFNMVAGPALQLSGAGVVGHAYILQATPDLTAPINWISIATNTVGGGGQFQFTDSQITNQPQRFYRIMAQ